LLVLLIPGFGATLQGKVVIRMGTLAPDGSAWHKIFKQMGMDWRKSTDGELVLRIYAGGVVGDEGEMIRKMRIGQLQCAAISNSGVAEIDASGYALMLPMMFDSYEEWDYVRQKVNPQLEAKLEEKGFKVLAWSDVGWVYFFTKEPLKRPGDLKNMKLAASPTEAATVEIMKWAGFNPVPISWVDWATGLQTGLIDAFYLPVILAEGSQFYRHARNMSDMKWAPLQGALVMHERGWKKLTADQQDTIVRVARQVGEDLRKDTRRQEQLSLEAMKKRGLEIVSVDDDAVAEWHQTAEKAYPQVREKLVPPEMFDRVKRLRDEFRATRGRSSRP
jgi:TRAP-type C4-dicarboxylate transport system substrate-binding protein